MGRETDPIRAILVDDERLMRQHLRGHLKVYPDMMIVGEADSVAAAWELIAREKPEVVFLDVQMSPEDGFALLPLLEEMSEPPAVVFVTAFDEYAIRAFETNALDYLTKPVNPERLKLTVERIRQDRVLRRVIGASQPVPGSMAGDRHPASAADGSADAGLRLGPEDLVMLSEKPAIRMTRSREIRAVESQGNYTLFYLEGVTTVLMNRPLRYWEERLPEELFLKASRSLLVNAGMINRVVKLTRDEYELHLSGLSKPIPVGRLAMQRIKDALA
jgi:two-component system, LytTR family, response regulator